MSEFADALGLPTTIRHAPWKRDKDGQPVLKDGKPERLPEREFQLAPPDQFEVMGRWEQYLEQQAWQALQRRYAGNPGMLQAKENDLTAAIVGGDYSVFGDASVKAMGNKLGPHFRKFIYFCLVPYIEEKEAEHIAEEFAREQASQIMHSFRDAARSTDPNSKGPAGPGRNGESGSELSLPKLPKPESPILSSGAA